MRVSPLLLTIFVLFGLAAIAVPVWHLTSGAPAYSVTHAAEQNAIDHIYEEVDLVIWVSHIPATVTLQSIDGKSTTMRVGDDELQEVYAEISVPVDEDAASLVVTVEHESDAAVESALTITAHRGDQEARKAFFKFSGFGEEELTFDWSSHQH